MCGQHNVWAFAEDNTGQNTDKGHTPNPRREIKIPDPAGNRTKAACSAHSPTLPSLHLRHNSFSNPSIALPTSQLILQPFHRFTYVPTHSPTFPSLYLRHNSFSNHSVASLTSQFIIQPFFRFSYVTRSSLNSPDEPPMS